MRDPSLRFHHGLPGRMRIAITLLVAGCLVISAAAAPAAQQQAGQRRIAPRGPCAERGASDLYCLDLHANPEAAGATGSVDLGRVPSPFGVAVTPAGNHIYELTAHIAGLPAPGSFGPYSAYVAWAATPFFDPVIKLGVVDNGINSLGRVELNKFLILITAEATVDVEERSGRLVLRGRSPALFMNPHDLMTQAPSAVLRPMNRIDPVDVEAARRDGSSRGRIRSDQIP